MRLFAFLSVLLVAACGTVDFDQAPVGRFEGSLLVMWVGEGDRSGDGKFVFVPSPNDPLRFVRNVPGAQVTRIQPEIMYTDGGSIPRAGQFFNGFSPWGYAPAYMIHDWLFVVRQCLNDGMATPAEQKLAAVTFADSAQIMAESIKTLVASGRVAPNDIAPRMISGVVAGPFSYERWVVRGECSKNRLSAADRAQVDRLLRPRAGIEAFTQPADGASGPRIVSRISF